MLRTKEVFCMSTVVFPRQAFRRPLHIGTLYSAFSYRSPRDFSSAGESHDFWECIYIDKGQMLITAGEQQYILKAGELAFHKPNEFHAVRTLENTSAQFIICSFECKSPLMKFFEHKILHLNATERQHLRRATEEADAVLCHESRDLPQNPLFPIRETPAVVTQTIINALELLLLSLYQNRNSTKIEPRVASYATQNKNAQVAELVKGYLVTHLSEKVALKDIAAHFCYSVSHLKKLFHRQTGTGVIDYFIDLKIKEAKFMIRKGECTFTEIAASLGYDTVYFSKLFKARAGMTMTEYAQSISG